MEHKKPIALFMYLLIVWAFVNEKAEMFILKMIV
jgi:hypothetical protein